jgi:2-polyprenyl-3-methyl-5-hydroxy-6-metoxy-1,4-benzoquinol methylase
MNFINEFKCGKFRKKFIEKMIRTGEFYRNKNGVVLSKEYPENEKNNFNNDGYGKKKPKNRKKNHYPVINRLCKKYYSSPTNVLEVGPGNGYFAKMYINKFKPKSYTLYDTSDRMIKIIKNKFLGEDRTKINIKNKSFKDIPKSEFNNYDCVLGLQVFEHINWDKEFLYSINSGTWVFFSVPRVHGFNHVRAFMTPDSIYYRYHDVLDICEIREVVRTIHFKSKHNYPLIFAVAAKRK